MSSCAICFMLLPKFGVGILDAGPGRVLRGVGGAQHLDRFECFFAGGVEDAVAAVAIHGFKGAGGG